MKLFIVLCLCGPPLTLFAQSKYFDAKYSVSLQYPKGYVLIQGDLSETDKGLGYLGSIPMEFAEPGGVRVVTLEAADGSYPGTDFVNAFFTVSINQHLTRKACVKFSDEASGSRKQLVKSIGGIEFRGLEQGSAGASHQFDGVYYHGFANGSCYEFGYGLATAGYGAIDGIRRVSEKKVFAILERILNTAAIRNQKARQP
jgi:hypothetical protein